MKKPKQLCFSFINQRKDVAQLGKYLQVCKRLAGLLMMAQILVILGLVWIRTI